MEQVINNIEASIRKLADNVEESRTVTFIASTSSVDRHGTVLNQDNWNLKNFNNNPIIGYQHNVYGADMCNAPNPDDQLGSARAYFETVKKGEGEEKQLLVDITFEPESINPLAEKIFRKVLHGSLRAVSVGFVPLTDKEGKSGDMRGDNFHYFGQELLEVSVVNIPSNPDALKRNIRESTSNVLTFLTKKLGKRYSDVESMTVRDVLDILENNKPEPKIIAPLDKLKEEVKKYCNLQEKRLLLINKMSKH